MAMHRKALVAAMLVVMVLSMGCTAAKQKPEPVNPAGPLLDFATAVSYAKGYMYHQYQGSGIVVDWNVTRKMEGTPCAWNGADAGNTTRWLMYLEGVMIDVGIIRYIDYAVQMDYRDGKIYASSSKVDTRTIAQSEINATRQAILGVSLEPYLNNGNSNHDIFLRADEAKYAMSDQYYLHHINMTLYHNTTSPHAPGAASWEVGYQYIDKSDYSAKTTYVVVDAGTGRVMRAVPPR